MIGQNRVVLELGTSKVFASAIDWPGWSRSGKTEQESLEVLRLYAARYEAVAKIAGIQRGDVRKASTSFEVIEHTPGNATTDFGAPGCVAICEAEPLTDSECQRQVSLLRATWRYFDDTAAHVSEELRKGPRGGGRTRSQILEHVLETERTYARKIGVRTKSGTLSTSAGVQAHRDAVCQQILAIQADNDVPGTWPLRYLIRRAAWHVLDHAWEMEEKDLTRERS